MYVLLQSVQTYMISLVGDGLLYPEYVVDFADVTEYCLYFTFRQRLTALTALPLMHESIMLFQLHVSHY